MSEVAVGSVIDSRYKITGELGKGGMGTVYRAEHVTIRRPVALKLLDPVLSKSAAAAQRFEREAFAAGRIDHPNCVTVSDFGTHDDGTLYLVMELAKGDHLGDILDRDGRFQPRRALHVIRHVLSGLSHAHESGIVHRDIKPENILLVKQGDDPDFAKILDFGIAKLLGDAEAEEGGDKLTQAGFTVGTPAYLSPEQAFGEEIDLRTDLYSASVVLYEMLTGTTPFRSGDNLAVLAMHVGKPVPSFKEVAPDMPPMVDIEAMVNRGLAKKRDERIATAEQYIAELDGLIALPRASTPVPIQTASPSGTDPTMWASAATYTPPPQPATTSPTPTAAAPRSRRRLWIGAAAVIVSAFVIAAVAGGITGERDQLFESYSHQLAKGKTCGDRKEAVAKLRSLGDKRAIKGLKKARRRMRGGLAGIGAKNSNRCLRKDADSAIEYLKGL